VHAPLTGPLYEGRLLLHPNLTLYAFSRQKERLFCI